MARSRSSAEVSTASASPESKYNDDRHRVIVTALRAGNFMWVAAHLAGISESTLKRWIDKGQGKYRNDRGVVVPADPRYKQLANDVRDAMAAAEARAVAQVEEGAAGAVEEEVHEEWEKNKEGEMVLKRKRKKSTQNKDWRAAAFLLERRHSTRWGQRNRMEVEQNINLTQTVVVHEGPAPHPELEEGEEPREVDIEEDETKQLEE